MLLLLGQAFLELCTPKIRLIRKREIDSNRYCRLSLDFDSYTTRTQIENRRRDDERARDDDEEGHLTEIEVSGGIHTSGTYNRNYRHSSLPITLFLAAACEKSIAVY